MPPIIDETARIAGYIFLGSLAPTVMAALAAIICLLLLKGIEWSTEKLMASAGRHKGTRRASLQYRLIRGALFLTHPRTCRKFSRREIKRFLWRRRRHNALAGPGHRCSRLCFVLPRDKERAKRRAGGATPKLSPAEPAR